MSEVWPAITKEHIRITITADEATVLDTQTVEFAFMTSGSPQDGDWTEAEWVGDPGNTREARLLVGPEAGLTLPRGVYNIWYRITDSTEGSEIPARPAALLHVI